MKILNSIEETNRLIQENRASAIYFSSNNCGVCTALFPKIEELFKSYPKINIAKVDIDNLTVAAGTFSVFSLPCILVFIDQKEIIREARFISINDLKDKIDRYYEFI